MPRRRFFRRSRSARRKLVWNHSLDTETGTTTFGSFDVLSDFRTLMGISSNLPGATIARIRGAAQYIYDPNVAATSLSGTYMGFVVGDIGITPAFPLAQPNADWMYREWFPDSQPGQVIDPAAGPAMSSVLIDVKAMRKMQEVGQTLFFTWVRTSTPNVTQLTLACSVLMMLP